MTCSSPMPAAARPDHFSRLSKRVNLCVLWLGVVSLVACGGGAETSDGAKRTRSETSVAEGVEGVELARDERIPAADQTIAQLRRGAQLNSEELAQIAKTGILPRPFDGKLLSGAEPGSEQSGPMGNAGADKAKAMGPTKSAASRVPVFRFFNNNTSAHFFTTSTAERDNVQATLPFMSYEGPAFYSSATTVPGLSPVHRFYNTQTGVHFYTISEAERANVAANLPQFNYEGIAYYASTLAGTGYVPLYRFFYGSKGFHFYTNSLSERDSIIASLPQYSYEGVGYYVLGSDWQTPAVPHTGVTSQCFESGRVDMVLDCSTSNVLNLNDEQDAHRTAVNPMSYSAVNGYPLTSCVKDNLTGMIWEGKEPSGVRAGTLSFTHLGNGSPGDVSAYVSMVNAQNLCGFDDWRLPTVEELQGLLNFETYTGARIAAAAFPNTTATVYWTSELKTGADRAWWIDFSQGSIGHGARSSLFSVRLVHGAVWSGSRYVVGTEPYAGDEANNAVLDRKTGLTWRRCLQGQAWAGNTCTGAPETFLHQAALSHTNSQTGWRLPNIKELASLMDRTTQAPAHDQTAFPGSTPDYLWSSTPSWQSGYAWNVVVDSGAVAYNYRLNDMGIRLVRMSQ